jgi:ribokinase
MGFDIVVVGSINQDLTVRVPHHPAPGETVLGTSHVFGAGGKGANQAVAAARLGRRVAMIGRVGDDQPGRDLVRGLEAEGVDVSHVGVDGDAPTGIALITLDDHAENAIAVSPGANGRLNPGKVEEARRVIVEATVVLVQLEVPIESVQEAASLATGTVILNPAPAEALPDELAALADVIVPNRSELATLAGVDLPTDIREVTAAAHRLSGDSDVIVTLGSDGAVVFSGGQATPTAAPKVDPVDTTGAGDAFCGALADALSRGMSLEDSARWAVAAGASAVTRQGAQTAMPTADDVALLIGD